MISNIENSASNNNTKDEQFLELAIEEAKKGDFPWGAVITKNGKVISRAHNTMLSDIDSTAHAEINAIRKACKKLNSMKIPNCTLYTVANPCPMCFSAAWRAGIKRIVYAVGLPDRMNINIKILNKMSGNKIKIEVIKIKNRVLREDALKLYDKFEN